jgi:hypothetical protein
MEVGLPATSDLPGPWLQPGFSPFHQLAWITPDIERSVEQFRTSYNVPSFHVFDTEFNATVGGETGIMSLRLALVYVDDIQLELIQPLSTGVSRIYTDVLPRDGSHRNVFHHVCVKVNGSTLDDWDAHIASLPPERPVYYTGEVGPTMRFAYTDERELCGMYVEHVWFMPEAEAAINADIPRYYSKRNAPA